MKQGWYKSTTFSPRELFYINRRGDKFLLVRSKKVRCFSSSYSDSLLIESDEKFDEFVEWFDLEGENPLTDLTINDVIIIESLVDIGCGTDITETDLMVVSDNLSHLIDYSYDDFERFKEEWVPKFKSKLIGRESRDLLSSNNLTDDN